MKFIYSLLLLFFCSKVISQSLSINTDGSTANSSALLDVKSTTKGLLLPRMTKAQKNAIATAATGLLVFQTGPDSIGFHYFNGSTWLWLNPAAVSNDWKITGNSGTDTAVNFIGNIDDEPLRFKQNNTRMAQFDINKGNYYIGKAAALKNNSSAVKSIGIGDSTLQNNTSGINNIAIGTGALNTITTGSNNTAIGYQSDVFLGNATNATAVGAYAQAFFSNTLVLGSINGINGATASVKVGIGVDNPLTTLHVRKGLINTNFGGVNAMLMLEDSVSSYIQLYNPDDAQSGIISGTQLTTRRSSIFFNADSSMEFRTGGNNNRVNIKNDGKTGIATTTPQAFLDVNNTFKLGDNGTVNSELIKRTVNIIVGSIPGNGELDVIVAVPNVATTAAISITPSDDLPTGIIIVWSRVSSAGNVKVRFRNLTASAINPANIDYEILAVQ